MSEETTTSLKSKFWHYEDELPDGYPYDIMFCKSRIVDGVRMFPPVKSADNDTARRLALEAENSIFEALTLSGDPLSKDTETWLSAAAMMVRRAIESI